ncbi:hypothetical protein SAMN05444671_0615 [Flavobacterium sp. CF108]|uniref:hypothetical protein n=1 Tax=unclassified Flavobacterium TaxID=196869 RepID=UPI0008D514B2|nr:MULTISPECIES: hypothetical protein [unclassified Flavobacterium]SEO22765.1 hypothetical protein SAMN04487978_2463 [Flavobacterium sp. fv08]SHG50184.1 hypothetical protein SAMN05444671_0615 [Flavobacterium sp. CF108]
MNKEEKIPFETIEFAGVTFKVINRHEAHTIIGDLTDFNNEKIYNVFEDIWRFPDYEENPIFLLAEDDVEMDSFEMDFTTEEHQDIFILGFIFKGNLNVKKLISSFDTDNSPALIVLGETKTVNLTLFGSVHYLGGGLKCDTIIGEYNHGELFVKGDVTAGLIYSDDMLMHFERFTDVQAIVSVNRPDIMICSNLSDADGNIITIENYFPSTHKLSDIVDDSFIKHSEYGTEILGNNYHEDVFREGLSILDYDKKEKYMYTDFRIQFINRIEVLSQLEYVKHIGRISKKSRTNEYSFVPFTYEGKKYSQISEEIGNGFNIKMRALWCHDDEEITLVLEYLDEDGDTKYQWANNETAPGIEMFCVKCAALEAFEVLTKETSDEEDEDDDEETEYQEYDNSFSLEEFSVQFGNYVLPEDLIKLYQFDQKYGSETYSECFGLLIYDDKTGIKTWSEEEEFYTSFIEFAGANGSGSSYAYWLIDKDLNNCPIVVFGDEGGIHVVAENTCKLIHLLTLDTEISVDFDNAYFYKDEEYYEENENKEEFQQWAKKEFNLDPIESNEETDEIVDEAKAKYKKQLNDFLIKFDIEIGEDED